MNTTLTFSDDVRTVCLEVLLPASDSMVLEGEEQFFLDLHNPDPTLDVAFSNGPSTVIFISDLNGEHDLENLHRELKIVS